MFTETQTDGIGTLSLSESTEMPGKSAETARELFNNIEEITLYHVSCAGDMSSGIISILATSPARR